MDGMKAIWCDLNFWANQKTDQLNECHYCDWKKTMCPKDSFVMGGQVRYSD